MNNPFITILFITVSVKLDIFVLWQHHISLCFYHHLYSFMSFCSHTMPLALSMLRGLFPLSWWFLFFVVSKVFLSFSPLCHPCSSSYISFTLYILCHSLTQICTFFDLYVIFLNIKLWCMMSPSYSQCFCFLTIYCHIIILAVLFIVFHSYWRAVMSILNNQQPVLAHLASCVFAIKQNFLDLSHRMSQSHTFPGARVSELEGNRFWSVPLVSSPTVSDRQQGHWPTEHLQRLLPLQLHEMWPLAGEWWLV